jgi:hypothetical protein
MKMRMAKADFDELLIESQFELGLITEESSVDMSQRELLALKAQAIKEGLTDFFKNFKISDDQVQLKAGNKAIISDGTGTSYLLKFEVNAWNPPTVGVKEFKRIELQDEGSEEQEAQEEL